MSNQNFPDNVLYNMDNLEGLRGMNSETVDLIATDPPFNTQRNRAGTAGQYEDSWRWENDQYFTTTHPDQWKWVPVHELWLDEIKDENPGLAAVIEATRLTQGDDTAAFLCFLGVRLLHCHRILKPTGSLYLHCDHSANGYIRMVLDAIFGSNNFRNEIIWKRSNPGKGSQYDPRQWGYNTDTLFYYTKSDEYTLNPYIPRSEDEIIKNFPKIDENGERYNTSTPLFRSKSMGARPNLCFTWRGFTNPHPTGWRLSKERMDEEYAKGNIVIRDDGKLERRKYVRDDKGYPIGNLWTDINFLAGDNKERTGSPDQKPVALYERIIKASSNEGDLVLDPFAGCITTLIAADNLNRRYVGIDRRTDLKEHVVARKIGMKTADLQKKLSGKDGLLPESIAYLDDQIEKHGIKFLHKAPERNDDREIDPNLETVYTTIREQVKLTHSEMKGILEARFGLQCWGCDFMAPDSSYLEFDHIAPKSEGGSNQLENRSLLCTPCNRDKKNLSTLNGVRRHKKKTGRLTLNPHPIDILEAVEWCKSVRPKYEQAKEDLESQWKSLSTLYNDNERELIEIKKMMAGDEKDKVELANLRQKRNLDGLAENLRKREANFSRLYI